jgi:hypothetical protein
MLYNLRRHGPVGGPAESVGRLITKSAGVTSAETLLLNESSAAVQFAHCSSAICVEAAMIFLP